MCSNHHQYAKGRCGAKKRKSAEATRREFYNNLVVFCAVNAYFLLINDRFESWYWVTFFWGISMLNQYQNAKWALGKEDTPNDDDDIVPPPSPQWKDKDLV